MTTRTVVFGDQGQPEVRETPMPQLGEDEILVRVRTVGLNAAAIGRDGLRRGAAAAAVGGYAGTVEEVGSRVTKELKKGDRVAGVARGAADGVLAEYVAAKGDLQIALPDGLGDEEAAALGGPLSMVCQALYGALQLPPPPASWFVPQSILIHGGDTAAGRLGIQLARRSGLRVFATMTTTTTTTTTTRRDGTQTGEDDEKKAVLRRLGATAVFDGVAAPSCAADIRALSRDRLTMAWDCTGGGTGGAALCAGALSATETGVYYANAGRPDDAATAAAVNANVTGPRELPAAVAAAAPRVYETGRTAGEDEDDEAYDVVCAFWASAQALLGSGDLEVLGRAPVAVNHGGAGLEGVCRGLEELRARRRGMADHGGDGEEEAPQLVYTL